MYQPNFNDPRTQKRVKKAIAFANGFLSETKPRNWSTRYIDKFFGQQQHELSIWLRSKLLICTNERYAKDSGLCKEYIRNQSGLNEVFSLLNGERTSTICVSQVTTDFVKDEFKQELKSKRFTYEDKSSRLWHDLQRVKREYKEVIFRDVDLCHQYDIQCCAPTLIHQYSQQLPEVISNDKYIQGPMDLYLFALREYLNDRNKIRNQIATEAEITYEQAKVIINALLMGAKLANNEDSDIYHILSGDRARIEFLKQHEFLCQLRNDIKTCWSYIKPTLPQRQITTKSGTKRVLPISTKQKSIVYFDLERKVLNSIRDYLDRSNNKYFLEHDGFVCVKPIQTDQLSNWVKFYTGFQVKFDYKHLV